MIDYTCTAHVLMLANFVAIKRLSLIKLLIEGIRTIPCGLTQNDQLWKVVNKKNTLNIPLTNIKYLGFV